MSLNLKSHSYEAIVVVPWGQGFIRFLAYAVYANLI